MFLNYDGNLQGWLSMDNGVSSVSRFKYNMMKDTSAMCCLIWFLFVFISTNGMFLRKYLYFFAKNLQKYIKLKCWHQKSLISTISLSRL